MTIVLFENKENVWLGHHGNSASSVESTYPHTIQTAERKRKNREDWTNIRERGKPGKEKAIDFRFNIANSTTWIADFIRPSRTALTEQGFSKYRAINWFTRFIVWLDESCSKLRNDIQNACNETTRRVLRTGTNLSKSRCTNECRAPPWKCVSQ